MAEKRNKLRVPVVGWQALVIRANLNQQSDGDIMHVLSLPRYTLN